jgi:hypothetical protein
MTQTNIYIVRMIYLYKNFFKKKKKLSNDII